jgi:hypothetical protein
MSRSLGLLAVSLIAIASSAKSETYHVGAGNSGCAHGLMYQEDPSVAAMTAPDVNAPPESPIDTETLTHPPLALHLPIEPYLNAPVYNADLSRSELELGTLTLNHRGQLRYNNEMLSSGDSSVYSGECQ